MVYACNARARTVDTGEDWPSSLDYMVSSQPQEILFEKYYIQCLHIHI